jgi:hypothetical protein
MRTVRFDSLPEAVYEVLYICSLPCKAKDGRQFRAIVVTIIYDNDLVRCYLPSAQEKILNDPLISRMNEFRCRFQKQEARIEWMISTQKTKDNANIYGRLFME